MQAECITLKKQHAIIIIAYMNTSVVLSHPAMTKLSDSGNDDTWHFVSVVKQHANVVQAKV